MSEDNMNALIELEFDPDWNSDIQDDIDPEYARNLKLQSRDWTIETIVSQIDQKNINLYPKFQRRNAWTDIRRSRLIESLILGIPVPEIMLAEGSKRRSYIVIDGKQRLLTISGFIHPDVAPTWDRPVLRGLQVLSELNGMTYADLEHTNSVVELQNANMRCSIISDYTSDDVLYDIFYRLNTGSVPLSSQELRQVLHPGDFANYLIQVTNQPSQPIHKVLGLTEPDKRLRDVELVLRFISFVRYSKEYRGNLKRFLDDSMRYINDHWKDIEPQVSELYGKLNDAITLMIDVFEGYRNVGRKYTGNKFESRFNKVLFEVEAYYFIQLGSEDFDVTTKQEFLEAFKELSNNPQFRDTIEASTKNLDPYRQRYQMFGDMITSVISKPVKPMRFS